MREYFNLIIIIIIGVIVGVILVIIPLLGIERKKDERKLGAYECGFEPYSSGRIKFEVSYYIVAILFLLFDIEIMFILPCVIVYKVVAVSGFLTLVCFLLILTIGFVYEWGKGSLDV